MQDNFDATVQAAYADTMDFFTKLAADDDVRKYVCPPARHGRPGFTIFYTPPALRPVLSIIGQNPSNFAGNGTWTAEPNGVMLSGTIPDRNSYRDDRHFFANSLGTLFDGNEDLLADAVGLNAWHFQATSDDAKAAPQRLKRFCEATTRTVVGAMKPKTILCFSRYAFYALSRDRKGQPIKGTLKAEWLDIDESRVWYVYHPTSSRTRDISRHDSPIVLNEIAAYVRKEKAA